MEPLQASHPSAYARRTPLYKGPNVSAFALKIIIVLLFAAVVASLSSGLWFLLNDQQDSKRTLYALGIRITLAALLVIAVAYGVLSGTLAIQAPWNG